MEEIKSLLNIHCSLGKLKKNKKHGGLGYKYAELSQVLEMLHPVLEREKKYITFDIVSDERGDNCVCLVGALRDENNNIVLESRVPLLGINNVANTRNSPMQNLGSAITYARRYCLLNMFNLCAEDDDGEQGLNFSSRERGGHYGKFE